MGARLGQHFLTDPKILDRIASACVAHAGEVVLEIGPGRGGLTRALAARAARVVAIEADRRLAIALREELAGTGVTLVAGDALRVPWPPADVVCGNIPYQITSPLIEKALAATAPGSGGRAASRRPRVVFLVQREVADRLAARPGSSAWGALSAGVQLVAEVEKLFRVRAGAFHPRPRVESALVRLVPRAVPLVAPAEVPKVRALIRGCFQGRRRQLARTLRERWVPEPGEAERLLATAGIAPAARVETLAPAELVALARGLGDRLAS